MMSGTHDFASILVARPAFWPMVFLEWLAVLGITCWIAGISVHLLRKQA